MPEQVHKLSTLTLTGVQTQQQQQQQQQQALVFYSAAALSSRETSSSKSSSSSNCERLSRHACEQGHPLPSLAGANIDGLSQLQHHQQLLKAAADTLQHTGTLHNQSHGRSSSSGSDEAGPLPGAAFPREIAPSFSGWSAASAAAAAAAAGMQQHPSAKPYPGPSSTGGSQLQPLPAVLFSQAMHHPAAGFGFYSGMQAAGAPKTRARRKSASDYGAQPLPSPVISRRRKSTGSQHCGLFGALSAGCSFLSGAEGSSSRSGSLDSPAECLVSVTTGHSSPMEEVHSMGRPSQHHLAGCLLSIAEVDVPALASPGRYNLCAHQQQQQQQGLQRGMEQYGEQYSKPPCDAGAGLLPVAVARRSPTPPGDSSAICVSPRVSTLYQQYHSQGASSNSSRRAATEPPAINHNSSVSSSGSCTRGGVPSGRSPGAAAMVMSNKSTGGYQLPPPPQQQQHQVLQQVLPRAQQDSTAAAAAARAPPPVARDITQRLQSQGSTFKGSGAQASSGAAPDLQHTNSLWHTWALHLDSRGPNSQQQQQQQQTPSSSTAGSRPDSACSFDQYPRAQQLPPPGPVGSGGRALQQPQRSSAGSIGPYSSVAKSPAPPPVPPSPQQLHAAELRGRRSSCSSIPALSSGVLSPGPPQPRDHWSHLSLMGRGTSSTGHMTHAGDGSSSAGESGVTLLHMPPAVCDSVWSDLSAAPPSPGRAGLPQGSRRSPVRDQSGMQDVGRNHHQLQLYRHHAQAPGGAAGGDASSGSIREALDKLQGLPGSMHSTHGQQLNAAEHSEASTEQEQAAEDMAHSHCQQHHQQHQQVGLKASLSSAGHLNGSYRGSATAALPPLHPPAHQQHSDAPATPRGHVMLNPQLAPRSASAVLGSGTGLQPLHHPQQPVPPRQHAPPCRSPCVSARLHASALSPAAAAFMGGGGAFTSLHMACSPILEQVPSTSSNPSSNGSIRLGTDGRSPAAGPAGGSHHSSYNSGAVHGHSAASSNVSTTPTTDTSSGSGRQLLGARSPILPRPAFVQLARGGSCDSVFYQHHRQSVAVRSPSPPCALDTSAAVQGYSRPLRAVSPSIRKADTTLPGVHTSSSSSSTACQQQLQQLQVPRVVLSPSPPPDRPMGAAAMTASPRVHSLGGVQPCPPAHSQPPPSPSPSLRARLLTPHSSQTSGGLHGAAGHSMAQHAAAAGAAATGHAGQLQHADNGEASAAASAPAWAGSSPCVVGHPAPRGRLMLGGHDAAAEGLAAHVAPQVFSRPPALLQPASTDAAAADSGNTPDLSWMHATADGDPADRTSAPHAAATAGTAVRDGAGAKSAAAAEDPTTQPALEWPVVVAFGHYRGRLGYLMNSGVVGVLFEDASHMLMREGSRTACYIDSAVRSVTADPAVPVVGAHSSSCSTTPSEAGGAKAPVSAVQVGKPKPKSQLPHNSSSSSSIAAGVSSISRSNSTDTCHSDQTPAAHHSTPGEGAPATAACSQSRGADGLALKLPPPPCRDDGGRKDVSGDGDSSGGGVPEHLAAKVRCLQRFAGCLLHHTPYSSKRHVDVTRLALPGTWGVQHSQAQQQGALLLTASVVHIQHFSYSEGCVLLTLTNGAQQLVFTSDNSVMLLQSHRQQLAFITPPRRLKTPGAGSSSGSDSDESSTSDTCRDAARLGEAAGVVWLQLSAHTALPDDPRLQARLRQARCLPGVMQLPFTMGGI